MMTAPQHHIARDVVARLIQVCRDSGLAYELASKSVAEPMLRAELIQYRVQRTEFIAELHEALRHLGEDFADDATSTEGTDELRRAIATHDRYALLAECEREEAIALDAYREAIAAGLPYAVGGVVHTQFLAITRVRQRLQSLEEAAGGAAG